MSTKPSRRKPCTKQVAEGERRLAVLQAEVAQLAPAVISHVKELQQQIDVLVRDNQAKRWCLAPVPRCWPFKVDQLQVRFARGARNPGNFEDVRFHPEFWPFLGPLLEMSVFYPTRNFRQFWADPTFSVVRSIFFGRRGGPKC